MFFKPAKPSNDKVALLEAYRYILNFLEFNRDFLLQDKDLSREISLKALQINNRYIFACRRQIELIQKRFSAMIM